MVPPVTSICAHCIAVGPCDVHDTSVHGSTLCVTQSDSAPPIFRYWTFCRSRSSPLSSLLEVFGWATSLPRLAKEYCAWLTFVGALNVPPAPQLGPATKVRTSK